MSYFDEPGNPTVGKRLFKDRQCARCHTDPAAFPRGMTPIYLAKTLWNHGPRMKSEMSRRGITVEEFNQTHLSDLSAYPHALPCALYYFELNGDNFREHRHRVADILGIEPVEEYQLLWVKMHPDFQRPALQRLAA